MDRCLSALEWRFPTPSRTAATARSEETDLLPLHFFLSFSAQKSHVKPQKPSKPHLKPRNANKPNHLQAKKKSAKL
jgi:hypothetical protein